MNPSQIRIIDPILSQHARGYRQAGMVAQYLFPDAPVQSYGGQIIQFGKEAFRIYNSLRAAGGATKRITFGYEGIPFFIKERSLEGIVPLSKMRDAAAVPHIDLAVGAVNTPLKSLILEQENLAAQLARNPASYSENNTVSLTGEATWLGTASDPFNDVRTGREAIRSAIGMYPNTMIIGPQVISALDENPVIRERIKYTSSESVTTKLLAALFQVENVYVGAAVMSTDQNDDLGDVWGTDIVLAYSSVGSEVSANVDEPSYGYTYMIDGMPVVEEAYLDRNIKSWIYPVTNDKAPQIVGALGGYLIQGAGNQP